MSRILFSKNLFIFSASFASSSSSIRPLLLQFSHFATSSNYPSSRIRHEEESRKVRVSVWWDFESCNLPADANIYRISHCVTEAVRANGIKGPIQITAFGDVFFLTRAKQEALSSTGIILNHNPTDGKSSADKSLLVDLMYWVSQNPPPAHLFLISGDRDFAGVLHRLRMNNYNILLATPEMASNVLCSAATIMWHWNSLLKGENLSGKHFNHPPDGPFASWYGHHKVPLEDPFSNGEQSTCLQTEEISELRPIPSYISRKIRRILYSYPRGISITDLQSELDKAEIQLDKDYYGHKKFSRFLFSVGHIKLHLGPGGQLFVVPQKIPESINRGRPVPSTTSFDNEDLNFVATSKLSGEGGNMVKDEAGTPRMALSHEFGVEDVPEKAHQVVNVVNAQVTENQFPPKENEILSSSDVLMEKNGIRNESFVKLKAEDEYAKPTIKEADAGCHTPCSSPVDESVIDKPTGGSTETCSNKFDRRLSFFGWIKSWWQFWRSDENSSYLIARQNKIASNNGDPELLKPNLTLDNSDEPRDIKQTSSHSYEPRDLKRTASHSEEPRDMEQTPSHSKEPELSILKQEVTPAEEQELSESKQTVNCSGEAELFSSSSFWSDMESFIFTSKGSILVSKSRSRENMMQNFQKFGPMILRSLSEDDLLQLVDLLISEKKWLEERPSQTFPFRLTPRDDGKSSGDLPHGANGLSSIFLSRTTQGDLQKSSEGDSNKKCQSISHSGVSSPSNGRKHTERRSRTDILADTKKLVSATLRAYPSGINMGIIPDLFLERYGYPLDLKKLGHSKLASLLQTLPGVKVAYCHIFPADRAIRASGPETTILNTQETNSSDAVFSSDDELSDSYTKDESKDSPLEEFGPVSVRNSN